jgi:hypothetical protein
LFAERRERGGDGRGRRPEVRKEQGHEKIEQVASGASEEEDAEDLGEEARLQDEEPEGK